MTPGCARAEPVQIVADSGQVAPAYADIADLVLTAPTVIDAVIRSTSRITGAEAAGLPPGYARFYVTADVGSLLRGDVGVPPRIGYIFDVRTDANGRPPKLRKDRVLIFARPVSGRPGQIQLTDIDAQRRWSPELDRLTRQIIRDVIDPAAPPAITGVGNAFFVPGSLPGEGQTTIFLMTETGDPVSLLIDHQTGQRPTWTIALSDIVGQSGPPPQRDTLLWYRLACGLPAALPPESLAGADPSEAETARKDFQLVRYELGPCTGRRN